VDEHASEDHYSIDQGKGRARKEGEPRDSKNREARI
ncbi:MAG: hypothetical protein AVDCRST_MAG93-8913, partial [uncultured Chloroflexia bacterium]